MHIHMHAHAQHLHTSAAWTRKEISSSKWRMCTKIRSYSSIRFNAHCSSDRSMPHLTHTPPPSCCELLDGFGGGSGSNGVRAVASCSFVRKRPLVAVLFLRRSTSTSVLLFTQPGALCTTSSPSCASGKRNAIREGFDELLESIPLVLLLICSSILLLWLLTWRPGKCLQYQRGPAYKRILHMQVTVTF